MEERSHLEGRVSRIEEVLTKVTSWQMRRESTISRVQATCDIHQKRTAEHADMINRLYNEISKLQVDQAKANVKIGFIVGLSAAVFSLFGAFLANVIK